MARRSSKPPAASRDPLDILREAGTGRPRPRQAEPAVPDSGSYDDLLAAAVSLTSTLDLRGILNNIVDGIIRVSGSERGFLMLYEGDGVFSTFTGRYRDNREWDEKAARQISRTIFNRVVETHEPFVASDLEKVDELRGSDSIQAHRIRSAVCVPLLYKDALIGIIYADSGFVSPRPLDAQSPILRAFGAQAALAIENGRRHGELMNHQARLQEQNLSLRQQLSQEFAMSGMVSKNKRMLEVFGLVEKIAPHDISVLIQGESGTGKELLARAIHEKSPRADRLFQAVNCAGIPAGLVESILFGHRKGAFTGADSDKPGVFEIADGGTLFLDEIGDMPLEIQPKLLRVLQQREVSRLGEEGRLRKFDVRIVSATNLDLSRAVEQGDFREDLFYRLGVARIDLPPLRERREDIIPLADYFLSAYAAEKKVPRPELSRDCRALLLANPWVGNVRELKNAMDYGVAFQDDRHLIHAGDLERFFQTRDTARIERFSGTLRAQTDQFEEQIIRRTLAENGQNVTKAADALGISRQQLHTKIRKFGITTRPE